MHTKFGSIKCGTHSNNSPTMPKSAVPISLPQPDPKAQAKILDSYGKLPLSFEANHGQTDSRVKFLSRTNGYLLFLTGDEMVLTLTGRKASKNKTASATRILQFSMTHLDQTR